MVRRATRCHVLLRQQPTDRDDHENQQDNSGEHDEENPPLSYPRFLWRSRILAYFANCSMPLSAVSSSRAGMERNIFFTSSGSSTVFCSCTRAPAGVSVKLTHRASPFSRLLRMYPPRTSRLTVMLIVERLTPRCSASFDGLV